MQSKKLIFNSDDFGYSAAFNEGIKRGFESGVLTSTCILANGEAFDEAVSMLKNDIPEIGLGVHLNIIEGKSLTNCPLLTGEDGCFNNGYLKMILNSSNSEYLKQIEIEFRAQIEKTKSVLEVDHINSHVHTHAIPQIFELTCKLAREYGIKAVRTQLELPYFIPDIKKHLTLKYPINLVKNLLLNSFSIKNKPLAKKYKLLTNDYLIGVTYTGYMDEDAVICGLKAILKSGSVSEILIHPTYFSSDEHILKPFNYQEYLITQSETINEKITELGFQLTNYKNI